MPASGIYGWRKALRARVFSASREEGKQSSDFLGGRPPAVFRNFERLGGLHAIAGRRAIELAKLCAILVRGPAEAALERLPHLALPPRLSRLVVWNQLRSAVRPAFIKL